MIKSITFLGIEAGICHSIIETLDIDHDNLRQLRRCVQHCHELVGWVAFDNLYGSFTTL